MKHAFIWHYLLLISGLTQIGCSDEPIAQRPKQEVVACVSQSGKHAVAPPLQDKTIVAGVLPVSFAVNDAGEAILSLSISVPPGAAGLTPSIAMTYNSASGDGLLGPGFGISGASVITRCPKTMAIDGEIRGVQYDAGDALCLDQRRLVLISAEGEKRHYRTLPDTQTRIIEHVAKSYFDVFLPSGEVILYGNTPGTKPMAKENIPRAWLASEKRDARGNATNYHYCFAKNDEGNVLEYALEEMRYGSRAVSFIHEEKQASEIKSGYAAGVPFQQSLQLRKVQTSVHDALVRRYELGYEPSETTKRLRLASVQECGADGDCKPETRFQYARVRSGFEQVTTAIATPLSRHASYMLGDFNGDGLDDMITLEKVAFS